MMVLSSRECAILLHRCRKRVGAGVGVDEGVGVLNEFEFGLQSKGVGSQLLLG